ncbi:unnamed protein product, partial [Symbiodinium pilosum]
ELDIGDLPVRQLDSTAAKVEQFADAIMHHPLNVTNNLFDTLYKYCCENKFAQLPEPFNLSDPNGSYVHIFKHIYLHKNKVPASDCKQLRFWIIKPKFEKKITLDQQARDEGYKFTRDFGPKSSNRNQFMEWTDEHINTPGSKIEGWPEGKVKEALHNYMRGRQNAKTLEYWPFTLRSFTPWFFDLVFTKMLPTMRQHSITWIRRTRTGKSLGSKTILLAQSKYEIDLAERVDFVPSIVTAKHLDFFKAEPLTRFKPGVFNDGMLQRMDASFLKEEDATVWARYSSAHFEQGAGRHACNKSYDRDADEKFFKTMDASKFWEISHDEFLTLIAPSFTAVDDKEDMDAILARAHMIIITDSGVYYRVATTDKRPVTFIPWGNEPKDLLAASQHEIFRAYKLNPHLHQLPPSYHEDSAWSQRPPQQVRPVLLSKSDLRQKVKKENSDHAFRTLKNTGPHTIDLDSPSPSPQKRVNEESHREDSSRSSKIARSNGLASVADDTQGPDHVADDVEKELGKVMSHEMDIDTTQE